MPSEILNQLATSLLAKEASMAEKITSSSKPTTEFERWKFALSLPIMEVGILPDHAKTCPFCAEPYNARFDVAGEYRGHETATMFPCCRSIVGFHCARDWLLPHEGSFNFCPFCEKSFETSEGSFEWHVSTTEELLESGMATLVPQSTVDTDAPGEDVAFFPNVDETLEAGSSDADMQDATSPRGSPTILVTDPEGGISPGNEAKMVNHITNADTAENFSEAGAESPAREAKKSKRTKLKGWSLALAAAKAASRTHHRAGNWSGSRSRQSASWVWSWTQFSIE